MFLFLDLNIFKLYFLENVKLNQRVARNSQRKFQGFFIDVYL